MDKENNSEKDVADEYSPNNILGMDIPEEVVNRELFDKLSTQQFIYSFMGLLIGGASILFGIYLFVQGINGSTTWIAKVLGFQSEVTDAAPGIILWILGTIIIYLTRYSIKINRKN